MKNSQSGGNGKTLCTGGKRGSTSHDLTARQKLFALEYLKDLNATQAAIRVGYSPRTAEAAGSRLLRNVKVAAEIRNAMDARAKRIEISGDRVLQGIADLAFYDVRNFFDEKGNCKEIHELDDQTAKAVSGFEFVRLYDGSGDQKHAVGQLRKIRLADRGQNLERLGKHLKLFTDKVEHGLDDEARKLVASKLDFSRLADSDIERVARALEAAALGPSAGGTVPTPPAVLAPAPHKDS